jgi:hypothetical protein
MHVLVAAGIFPDDEDIEFDNDDRRLWCYTVAMDLRMCIRVCTCRVCRIILIPFCPILVLMLHYLILIRMPAVRQCDYMFLLIFLFLSLLHILLLVVAFLVLSSVSWAFQTTLGTALVGGMY